MIKQTVHIYLDGKNIGVKKISLEMNLEELRNQLKGKINDALFYIKEGMIDFNDEKDYQVKEIIEDSSIFLRSQPKNEIKLEEELTIIKKNEPIQGATEIRKVGEITLYQYPDINFNDNEESLCKVILVVGETGSGKTTLINALINFLMDIEYDDAFRYILIKEDNKSNATSSTEGINIYNIKTKKGDFKIIDTQGYGDTRGREKDIEITNKIRDAFMDKINSINCISFVINSTRARLDGRQKFIFSGIIDMFGEDIKENFMAMLTFSDFSTSTVLDSLKESVVFSEIIPSIKEPWYLEFNSKSILEKVNQNVMEKCKYEETMKNFKKFYKKIESLNRRSLFQSKEVLETRKKVEVHVKALKALLKTQMNKVSELDNKKKYIQENANVIINKKNDFLLPINKEYVEKVKLENGQKANICKFCQFTCHEDCRDTGIAEFVLKYSCVAFSKFKCTSCKNKCSHEQHELADYKYVYKTKLEYIPFSKVLSEYGIDDKNKDRITIINLIKKIEEDIQKLDKECRITESTLKSEHDYLIKIALNKNTYQSNTEFIDYLIEEEEKTQEEGYLSRIQKLKEMKEDYITITKIAKQNS